MNQTNPLLPIPKIYVPAVAGLIAVAVQWAVTGEFDEAELATALTSLGYAAIGYATPTDGVGTRQHAAGQPTPPPAQP